MGKISRLKPWHTLDDAAGEIAVLTGEFAVSRADLLQIALHGRLALSVVFPDDVWASPCIPVDDDKIEYDEVPSLDGKRILRLPIGGEVVYAPNGQALQTSDKFFELETDWPYQLGMVGGEYADLRQLFWEATGVRREQTTSLSGTFVSEGRGKVRKFYSLHGELEKTATKARHFYPLGSLPENAVLVITREEILRFVNELNEEEATPPSKSDGGPLASPRRWPWGSHHTELLGQLEAAAQRFWVNFDPTDNSTAPTNEVVAAWLQERGVSRRAADSIASILRPNGLPTGPRTSP